VGPSDKHIVPVRLTNGQAPVIAQRLKYVDATQNQFEAIRELVDQGAMAPVVQRRQDDSVA